MNRNRWIAVGLLVVLAVLLAWSKWKQQAAGKGVTVEHPQTRSIEQRILASGRLAFVQEVKLTAEVIAKVAAIDVREGDWVEAGQPVLLLERDAFLAELHDAEASLQVARLDIERKETDVRYLKRQLARKEQLAARQLLDEDALDEVRRRLETAQIDVQSSRARLKQAESLVLKARDRLSKTQILAPITGRVTSLDIKVGETAIASNTAIAGSRLMTIADTRQMVAEIEVDEADIDAVHVDQMVSLYAANDPERELRARVTEIAATARQVQGRQGLSFKIRAQLELPEGDAEKLQYSGLSCRAEIITEQARDALAVPLAALFTGEDDEGAYVFVAVDGKAEKRNVETGLSDDQWIEVKSGVSMDDTIITGPSRTLRKLKAGDRVAILDHTDD
jgi:HlyD family secretion protein